MERTVFNTDKEKLTEPVSFRLKKSTYQYLESLSCDEQRRVGDYIRALLETVQATGKDRKSLAA